MKVLSEEITYHQFPISALATTILTNRSGHIVNSLVNAIQVKANRVSDDPYSTNSYVQGRIISRMLFNRALAEAIIHVKSLIVKNTGDLMVGNHRVRVRPVAFSPALHICRTRNQPDTFFMVYPAGTTDMVTGHTPESIFGEKDGDCTVASYAALREESWLELGYYDDVMHASGGKGPRQLPLSATISTLEIASFEEVYNAMISDVCRCRDDFEVEFRRGLLVRGLIHTAVLVFNAFLATNINNKNHDTAIHMLHSCGVGYYGTYKSKETGEVTAYNSLGVTLRIGEEHCVMMIDRLLSAVLGRCGGISNHTGGSAMYPNDMYDAPRNHEDTPVIHLNEINYSAVPERYLGDWSHFFVPVSTAEAVVQGDLVS
jgi:hypothetical protein